MSTTTEPTNTTIEATIVDTDFSSLSTAQKIKHLEIEGYVVLPKMISPEAITSIREELDRLPTIPTDYSDNQRGHREVHFSDSPACINLIANPPMLEFLSTLFGDELVCTSCMFALSRPGHPGIAIHTDAQPYGSEIFGVQASSPRLVRVLYYLDDLTPERAPLKVIPHSHLSLHADGNPYNRYLRHPEEVMVCCKAGDAAIINQTIFHANYPNVSQENRRLLAIAYRPAWAGPIADIPDWPADKIAALPDHVRPLFNSLNTRKIDFKVPNRPTNMRTEAPGINPSRWND
ncbi:MAG: phytanoyl-CoA dioxygenase family protein [Planctomycetota bacterium]|nr:phytanoyl-CoA dioxygenase family protein [Planctomycetota bacterium]MDA1210864.1 phytanoyl-CoA dioxygenase family protein [Planctomycetota bacterium]